MYAFLVVYADEMRLYLNKDKRELLRSPLFHAPDKPGCYLDQAMTIAVHIKALEDKNVHIDSQEYLAITYMYYIPEFIENRPYKLLVCITLLRSIILSYKAKKAVTVKCSDLSKITSKLFWCPAQLVKDILLRCGCFITQHYPILCRTIIL